MIKRQLFVITALTLASLALIACTPRSPSPSPAITPVAFPTDVTVLRAPERDLFDLVARYVGKYPDRLTNTILYRDEAVGTQASFWVLDVNGPTMRKSNATLQHVSDTALWYVTDSIDIDPQDLERAANAFDDQILPEVLRLGTPNLTLPGKITVLNARTPGLAGYFASSDALPTQIQEFSNERVMMVMNGHDAGSESYLGTLAHELQHLTQWHVDSTEETWVAEGLAEFAADFLKLPTLPTDDFFANPTVSLSNWPDEPSESISAYAAGSLFFSYLYARRGLEAIRQVVSDPLDGTDAMEALFESHPSGFSSFFGDWLAANVARASSGPYAYINSPGAVHIDRLLATPRSLTGRAPQLGGWYLRVDPGNLPFQLTFNGASMTPVLPVAPHSGERCWWSNRGDGIDSTLTRSFDLRQANEAKLRFWSWYVIEDVFDRGYVAASIDNGESWDILEGERTTSDNPIGTSLGPSYTGTSDGWVEEKIDLSPYVGFVVLLRFNYITDDSINRTGWCIDDISVPEVGFIDDGEANLGWHADGFASVTQEGIPQRFVLRTITGKGKDVIVNDITLNNANDANFLVENSLVLVVGGLTPQTSQDGQFKVTASR